MSKKTVFAIAAAAVLLAAAIFIYRPEISTALVFAGVMLLAPGCTLWHLHKHRPEAKQKAKRCPT
ncbi:hypothetical protein [Rhizobium grahamii]|uniref:Transmembrane protein n=1 Tax=Rhizobium grahamii CCGE 502 TaxID=990285 RepID=S3HEV0_9HYPH|nr:hypothetical protein [Rhizobium grahamii]EPE96610.1 hypothetical protein RGCCGE502_19630 [Rhizobium grahamii CCGE 502]